MKGPGEPEIGVVYCTHGNETAGKKAVEKLLEEEPEFQKAVKFVFGNERAFEDGERFIDVDLNRSFPGDPESENYEERLASKLVQELDGLKNLDLHETVSRPVPFALFANQDTETIEALQSTGVEKAVEISYTPGCGVNSYGGFEVETGPRGTEESVEMAYRVLKNFLVNQGALEGEKDFSQPEIYSVYGEAERPEGDWQICVENFGKIGQEEKIAVSETGEEIFSRESFVPVLFSESYPEIFGFKAVRLEKVEERIYSRGN